MSAEATASGRRVRARRAAKLMHACALAFTLAACGGDDDDGDKPSTSPQRDSGPSGPSPTEPDASGPVAGGSSGRGGSNSGGRGGGSGASPAGSSGSAPVSGSDSGPPEPGDEPQACPDVAPDTLPELLSCTGLYADIASKDVASRVVPFAPAVQLWSDGAAKERWIHLPEGTQIDSSAPDAWKFPIGTKLFKEFSHKGHRVETRLFWKIGEGRWVKTSYHWNADETEATRFAGGDVDVAGDKYYIPSAKECDQCHKGRDDRALGFEAGLMGLPGATGLTLAHLADQGLLSDPPAATALTIGDDGTGKAAAALGWLHVNCGVSCHNANPASEGYSSRLQLHLLAEQLDGAAVTGVAARTTTIGVDARTPRWLGKKRITPGSPEQSLVHELPSMRIPARPKDQMPPIASRVVDADGVRVLADWIRSMPSMQ